MRSLLRFFAALLTVLVWGAGPAWAAAPLVGSAVTIGAPRAPAAGSLDWTDLVYLAPVAFGITMRKTAADIADKFSTRAQAAGKDYTDGVKGAGATWEANTKASEDAWKTGTQEAINDGRFLKGVTDAGSTKYQTNAEKLGAERYGPGIRNSKDAYSKGVAPYLDVLRGLTLPKKGARRSAENRDRAAAVAIALGNKKIGRT